MTAGFLSTYVSDYEKQPSEPADGIWSGIDYAPGQHGMFVREKMLVTFQHRNLDGQVISSTTFI